MAYRNGLLPGLFERELLGYKRSYAPNRFTHAYTCQGKHAGVIRVDPDGEACPPYSITYNQVVNECRFLTVGDEEGFVSIVDTWAEQLPTSLYTDHDTPPRAKWLAHNNTIFDMAWAKNDSVLYTASGDQHVGVWDTTAGRLLVYCAGHDGSVKAVCPHSKQPDVFASGSRDGAILLWDLRSPGTWSAAKRRTQLGPVLRIDTATTPGHLHGQAAAAEATAAGSRHTPGSTKKTKSACVTRRSVTSLLFVKNEHTMISSSDCDGVVKLWDLRSMHAPTGDITLPPAGVNNTPGAGAGSGRSSAGRRCRSGGKARISTNDAEGVSCLGFNCPSRCSRTAGITSMALSPAGDMLLVSSIDSCHYLYRVSGLDQTPVACLTGHRTNSFCVKSCFSPDGSHVLSGSTDKRAYIWDVHCPDEPPVSLPGHAGEVTAVAWCPADHCQIATAADDATLRVWTLDRGNDKYERQYEQVNVLFPAVVRQQGLWDRSGFACCNNIHVPQQQQMEQQDQAAAMQVPAPACSAVTADGAAMLGATSVSPPTTPQLPFWNSNDADTAAGDGSAHAGNAQQAADTPVGAAALGDGEAATAAVCQTPASFECKVECAGVSPSMPAPSRALPQSTPRLKQITIAQQLSAIKARQLTLAAKGTAAIPAAQPADTGRQQQQDDTNLPHHQPPQLADVCSPVAPTGTPQAAAQQPSQHQCSSTSQRIPTAAAAVSPAVQDQPQAFADWMNTLTPSPASSLAQEEQQQQVPGQTRLNTGLCLTQRQQKQHGSRASFKRGGVVELSTPWNLPSPVRQQRQQEQEALEAERLQQSIRLKGLSLQECDGNSRASPTSSRGTGRRNSLGAAVSGGHRGQSCCRLLQDEFEVYCDGDSDDAEHRTPAAAADGLEAAGAGAAAAGEGGVTAGRGSQSTAATPKGLSLQENLWQHQKQSQLPPPAGVLAGPGAGVVAEILVAGDDMMVESPTDIDMVPCSLPADMVAGSLAQSDSTQHTQQQEQQQQQHHQLDLEQLLEQPSVQGVRSPTRLSLSLPLAPVTLAARVDAVLSVLGTKPGAVLLAGAARTPLGDLSPLLPAEPDLTSPRGCNVLKSPAAAAEMLAAGSGGAWGGAWGGSASSSSGGSKGRMKKGLSAVLAGVLANNSPVRALVMSPPPRAAAAALSGMKGGRSCSRSPVGHAAAIAADDAGTTGSPIVQLLLHGGKSDGKQQQQQLDFSGLLTSPQILGGRPATAALPAGRGPGVQSWLLSPPRHSSPGVRKLSRLGDKQVSPLPSAGKHSTPGKIQQTRPIGSPVGVQNLLPGGVAAISPLQQPTQWQRHTQPCHEEQQQDHVPAEGADSDGKDFGPAAEVDHPSVAAAATTPHQPQQQLRTLEELKNVPGSRGGIKRSYVFGSNIRKKQCTLAALWAAKEPEVEDGASRFSGF